MGCRITRKISELGNVVGGATPSTKNPAYWDGNIPWLSPKDLTRYHSRFIGHGARNITQDGLDSSSTTMLPTGTVLFSSRAPIGYVAIAANPICTNQGFKSVVPNDQTDSLFLYYLLKANKNKIEGLASGTTFKEVSATTMRSLEVKVPASLGEQRAIASVLGALDAKIESNTKLNGYLAEYLKSCAKRLYREYERDEEADLSEGWHWTTIGEISEMVCRGITPKYNDESDELILGQTCIRNNLVLLENGRLHAPRKITEKWLKKYDLLINSTGVGSLGRTAQVWFDPSKLVVDSHVTIVRAADPRHALYMGFWAFEHERYIESLHTGSTGQTELPRDHVKAIRLVLPSDAELEKFNAVAQPAVELIVSNQKESKRLAELRDTLLPKLMSGEIDVSSVAI